MIIGQNNQNNQKFTKNHSKTTRNLTKTTQKTISSKSTTKNNSKKNRKISHFFMISPPGGPYTWPHHLINLFHSDFAIFFQLAPYCVSSSFKLIRPDHFFCFAKKHYLRMIQHLENTPFHIKTHQELTPIEATLKAQDYPSHCNISFILCNKNVRNEFLVLVGHF